ncbi:hypothetical protein [Streptomyces sp. NBRC 109706]|uniref:hypothetical protein n=1 Tax=Streptomyces sp. NBRC 109706 TaxID=1550035 RepID=UPI000780C440|nr:hypothetical protein [Streptomyces sp. NBRC 109706]
MRTVQEARAPSMSSTVTVLPAAVFDIHNVCADALFESALRAARIAGDDALGANVLGFWAVAAYNTDCPQDAETMTTVALSSLRGCTTPRVEAMLTTRRTRARAHLRDQGCWADLDRAEHLLADAGDHQDPGWAYWFGTPDIPAARAGSHRDKGQPDLAALQFAQTANLYDPVYVRDRALYLSRQADAEYDAGHIEAACSTASQALDLSEAITSRRTTAPPLDLANHLRNSSAPEARDFHERAHSTLTT